MASKKKPKAAKGELIATPPTELAPAVTPQSLEPEALIAQAIAKNVPVETMEKLLAMRKELKAEKARDLFFAAMSKLQSELPVIEKTKIVRQKGVERYRYAPLDVIVKQTQKIIAKNGFSYMIKIEHENREIKAVCVVTHSAGHSEESAFLAPISDNTFMNKQQHYASASTYAKRYSFCNALGILTGDEDDDSNSVPNKPAGNTNAPPPKNNNKKEEEFDFNKYLKRINDTDDREEIKTIYREVTKFKQTDEVKKMTEIIIKKGKQLADKNKKTKK